MSSIVEKPALVWRVSIYEKYFYQKIFPILFALLYAGILASFPLDIFVDRDNYAIYVTDSDKVFIKNLSSGLMALIANEPLWLAINIFLSRFLDEDVAFRAIIFIPAYIVSYNLIKENYKNSIVMIFFLMIPIVVKNHIIHLRQGFAIAVFVAGYFSKSRFSQIVLMGLSGFIHSSFMIINSIGLLNWIFKSSRLSLVFRITLIFIIFLILGASLEIVAAGLGARQGDRYLEDGLNVSGLGFVFWSFILVIFLSSGTEFLKNHMFAVSVLVFYICAYFLTPVSGRVFESGLFLVLLAGLSLTSWRRSVFVSSIFSFTLIQYVQRLDQPWFGWAVTT